MLKKSAWIVLAAALLVILPVRLYQIFYLIDPKTGFYMSSTVGDTLIPVALAAGAAVLVVLCFLVRRSEKEYQPFRSPVCAVLCVLAGSGLIVESLVSMAVNGEQNYFMYMILSLFGILAGVVLILTAYGFAIGQNTLSRHPLLALLPPIWGCVCLFALFITYVGVVNFADNIYNTFAVIFLLLFLFTQAKMFAGIERERASFTVRIVGMPAVLFLLATGVPGAVVMFTGVKQVGAFPEGLYFVNILMALYILSFLLSLSRVPAGAESALPAQEAVVKAEDAVQPAEQSEWNGCAEYLANQYKSTEIFTERVSSPFQKDENQNC